MAKARYNKKDFPVDEARSLLEPGPIVLISSAYKGERNIMTLGWHMMLGYELVGCYIWDQDHSFSVIRKSRECVINVPTADMIKTVIGIGTSHGPFPDKFETFGLTASEAEKVGAPLINECYANFECRLIDLSLIKKYSLFVFEVVKAHKAISPRYPETVHYRGGGVFMISGKNSSYRRLFKPEDLEE
jgi:flavin reductase (DIM6/NTAB) family NADH-FMN oxidoreductase RutF